MIPPYKSNHASTLEVLPDGTLAAAWFSGEEEEASGCAIVFATLPSGGQQWSKAATLSKRDKFSNQNPVLFYDNNTDVLHLFHSQAPAMSGEGQSAIWHLQSSVSCARTAHRVPPTGITLHGIPSDPRSPSN